MSGPDPDAEALKVALLLNNTARLAGWPVICTGSRTFSITCKLVTAPYHSPNYALMPTELILINHGHDGDLDCYDLSRTDETSRISICYLEANESEYPLVSATRRHIAFSLAEYLEPHLAFWERIRRESRR